MASALDNEFERPPRDYSSSEGISEHLHADSGAIKLLQFSPFNNTTDTEDASESDVLHLDGQDTSKNRFVVQSFSQ